MPLRPLILGLACLCIVAAGDRHADTVRLKDGSTLIGEVQRLVDGRLTIETGFAGALDIPVDQLAGLTTEGKRTVALDTGDRLVGRLVHADSEQRLVDTAFGEVTIEPNRIDGLWSPDAPAPQTREMRERHEAEVAEIEQRHEQQVAELTERQQAYEQPWSFRLEAGLNGETGNNERLAFNGRAEARREYPDERMNIFAQGRFAEENGERSANEIKGGWKLEVDVSERWFVFGKLGLEFDEFEDLDLRATVSSGVGYFFIQEEKQELTGRAGLGYQHESFDDDTSEDQAVAEFGYDYRLDVNSWLRFTHGLTYYPTFEDPIGDYRVEAETAGELPLSGDEQWKLRLGMRNEYDANPQPGIENLDTYYFLNVVYDWE